MSVLFFSGARSIMHTYVHCPETQSIDYMLFILGTLRLVPMMHLLPDGCTPVLVKGSRRGVASQKHVVASFYASTSEDEQLHALSGVLPMKIDNLAYTASD